MNIAEASKLLDRRHRAIIQGRIPNEQEALQLATELGWPGVEAHVDPVQDFLQQINPEEYSDPINHAAGLAYYGMDACPLCDGLDCLPEREPERWQWWSVSEEQDAHLIVPSNRRLSLGQCGLAFEPFLCAYGILVECDQLQHHGACIVCLDQVLIRHRRSDCRFRGCRILELLDERDRGIFR